MERFGPRDDELVVRARSGEAEAFDALFGRYLALVRGEARRAGLQASEGDVVQESFLRAYLNLPALHDPAKFASWLRAIAHRVCLGELRHGTHREVLLPNVPRPVAPPAGDTGLRELLAQLAPEDREPLHLHYVLGFDTASAAKAMGVTPGTFRVRLHRARRRARALATSQQVEEKLIMSGQTTEDLASQLLAEAQDATASEAGALDDWPTFRAKLEQAHQADPEHLEIRWLLGRKLARDGDYRQAIDLLQPVWERQSDTWSGLILASCLDYLGRREQALQYYARVGVRPFLTETQRAIAAAGIEAPRTPKRAPSPAKGLMEVKNDGWSAEASPGELGLSPARGIDGDPRTRWSPGGHGQRPMLWYRLDLGEEVRGLAGIWLDDDADGQSIYQNDAPRRCLVSVSREGEWWKRVGEYRWSPNTYMEAWWEPISARYVLMEQTEYVSPEWWCIYEAHVFRKK